MWKVEAQNGKIELNMIMKKRQKNYAHVGT